MASKMGDEDGGGHISNFTPRNRQLGRFTSAHLLWHGLLLRQCCFLQGFVLVLMAFLSSVILARGELLLWDSFDSWLKFALQEFSSPLWW